jgi:hypothetical protein
MEKRRLRVGQAITPEEFEALTDAELARLVPRAIAITFPARKPAPTGISICTTAPRGAFIAAGSWTNRRSFVRLPSRMPVFEIMVVALLVGIGGLWMTSLKVREAAVQAARVACGSEGLLLLDDTVAIRAIRLARDGEGRLRLQRTYDFEYSDTGDNRRKGSVVLIGADVLVFNIGARDGTVIAFPDRRRG